MLIKEYGGFLFGFLRRFASSAERNTDRPFSGLIQLNICLPQSSEVNVICKCSKHLRTPERTAVSEKLAAGELNENQCTVSARSAH